MGKSPVPSANSSMIARDLVSPVSDVLIKYRIVEISPGIKRGGQRLRMTCCRQIFYHKDECEA